jgi:hypothetical protein
MRMKAGKLSREAGQAVTGLLVLLAVLLVLGGFFYFFTNLVPLSSASPERWSIDPAFQQVSDGRYRWTISYEKAGNSQFSGMIRHVTPDRMPVYPLLSHDVLVTSGDFADSARVEAGVDVLRHHFFWKVRSGGAPAGAINLLHTVPANRQILEQLQKLRYGDQVLITGREIDRIENFDLQSGKNLGYWKDDGCNTLVVTSVTWFNATK